MRVLILLGWALTEPNLLGWVWYSTILIYKNGNFIWLNLITRMFKFYTKKNSTVAPNLFFSPSSLFYMPLNFKSFSVSMPVDQKHRIRSATLSLVACWQKDFQSFFVWIYWHSCIDFHRSMCLLFGVLFIYLFLPFSVEGTVGWSRKITNLKMINIYCMPSGYWEKYKGDTRKKNERALEKEIRMGWKRKVPARLGSRGKEPLRAP